MRKYKNHKDKLIMIMQKIVNETMYENKMTLFCFLSNKTLADYLGCSVSTIAQAIRNLHNMGYIKRYSNYYHDDDNHISKYREITIGNKRVDCVDYSVYDERQKAISDAWLTVNTADNNIVFRRKNKMENNPNDSFKRALRTGELIRLIKQWGIDRGMDTLNPRDQALKLGEETGELFAGLTRNNQELIVDSIGDITVVLITMCSQLGIDIQDCMEMAYDEIKDRKGKVIDGVFVKEADLNGNS